VYFVIPVKLKNPENVYCLFFIYYLFIELHFFAAVATAAAADFEDSAAPV